MTKDVEHFLKCLSAILDFSVENSLFRSVPHFLIGLIRVLVSSFFSSLYILEISPLSDVELVKIFSHCVDCRFVLLTVSFALQKLFSFRRSHLLIISLSVCATGVIFRKRSPVPMRSSAFDILISIIFIEDEVNYLNSQMFLLLLSVYLLVYLWFFNLGFLCVSLYALELTL